MQLQEIQISRKEDLFQDLSSIRAAKNQKFVANDSEVADTDEVAFFPPVTGGWID